MSLTTPIPRSMPAPDRQSAIGGLLRERRRLMEDLAACQFTPLVRDVLNQRIRELGDAIVRLNGGDHR